MSVTDVTREELWAKQHLSCKNIDYAVWERDKSMLRKLSRINGGCSFVVDVYKGCYAYASTTFQICPFCFNVLNRFSSFR